jgi:hypothetical protein
VIKMAEYIEREKLAKALKIWQNTLIENYGENDEYARCLDSVLRGVDNVPAANVRPVVRGTWGHRWYCSNMSGYEYACSCSVCGEPTYRMSLLEKMPNFCPNCGAEMR